jgi:hypothetical protein
MLHIFQSKAFIKKTKNNRIGVPNEPYNQTNQFIPGTKVFRQKAPNVDALLLTSQVSRTKKRSCRLHPMRQNCLKRKNHPLKPKRKSFDKEIKVIAKFSDKILPSKAEVEVFGPVGRLPVLERARHRSLFSTCHTGVIKRHPCRVQVQQ